MPRLQKKMDMKKWKQSLWTLLTEFSNQADTEANRSDTSKEGNPVEVADEKMDLKKSLPPI